MGVYNLASQNQHTDQIYEFLRIHKDDWFSTRKIADKIEINWYKAEYALRKLLEENKIIVDEKPNTTYWKVKDEMED